MAEKWQWTFTLEFTQNKYYFKPRIILSVACQIKFLYCPSSNEHLLLEARPFQLWNLVPLNSRNHSSLFEFQKGCKTLFQKQNKTDIWAFFLKYISHWLNTFSSYVFSLFTDWVEYTIVYFILVWGNVSLISSETGASFIQAQFSPSSKYQSSESLRREALTILDYFT